MHLVPSLRRHGLAAALALVPTLALAQVPPLLSFQGRLEDGGGSPQQAPLDLTFRIYETAQSGSPLHVETDSVVFDDAGVFTTTLGDGPSLSVTTFDRELWVGITPDGAAELTPRLPFRAAPYAFQAVFASQAGSLVPTADLDLGSWQIENLGEPDEPSDAATKGYVDGHALRSDNPHGVTLQQAADAGGSVLDTLTVTGAATFFGPVSGQGGGDLVLKIPTAGSLRIEDGAGTPLMVANGVDNGNNINWAFGNASISGTLGSGTGSPVLFLNGLQAATGQDFTISTTGANSFQIIDSGGSPRIRVNGAQVDSFADWDFNGHSVTGLDLSAVSSLVATGPAIFDATLTSSSFNHLVFQEPANAWIEFQDSNLVPRLRLDDNLADVFGNWFFHGNLLHGANVSAAAGLHATGVANFDGTVTANGFNDLVFREPANALIEFQDSNQNPRLRLQENQGDVFGDWYFHGNLLHGATISAAAGVHATGAAIFDGELTASGFTDLVIREAANARVVVKDNGGNDRFSVDDSTIRFHGNRVQEVADPASNQDVANKNYVDNRIPIGTTMVVQASVGCPTAGAWSTTAVGNAGVPLSICTKTGH